MQNRTSPRDDFLEKFRIWPRPRVVEPILVAREYLAPWAKPKLDPKELAYLRKVKKWSLQRLQNHYRVGQATIYRMLKPIA